MAAAAGMVERVTGSVDGERVAGGGVLGGEEPFQDVGEERVGEGGRAARWRS